MFTLFQQIRHYDRESLRGDIMAGLTVAIMVVPQGMAYAMLAGLPPIYGLYAAVVPMLIYPFFGTSRQLSVGPVAVVSIIVLAGISELATPGTPEFIELAILTAFIAGIIQVLLAVFRMGFLVNFLSEPVIKGFTMAAAIIIGLSQVKYLLGLQIARSTSIIDTVRNIALHISETSVLSLLVGLAGLAIIMGLKRVHRAIPGALIAVVVSTLAVYLFHWHDQGLEVVGNVEPGLPAFRMIPLDPEKILSVIPLAVIICIISFIESLAIAKTIAARHHNYPIDANKELFGLGLAKVVGAFFQAFPNTGSFTRSAINDEAGARTGLSSIFGGLIIVLTLLFLTPLFYYLPQPILASIVIAAVVGLIDIKDARRLHYLDRRDFYVLATTFVLTLVLGVQKGVFAGVILSVVMIIYKSSRPHFAVLGLLEGTQTYRNIKRYPEARTLEGFLIFRYDVDIYFGNAEHFYDSLMSEVRKRPGTRYVIINMASIGSIDSTGLHKFGLLLDSLEAEKIKLLLAGARGEVRDALFKAGIQDRIGEEHCYLTIHDAVLGSQSEYEEGRLSRQYARQHNVRKG